MNEVIFVGGVFAFALLVHFIIKVIL